MPDVPITDETFVKDAQRKARALHLDSCVIWNFQYVQFYIYKRRQKPLNGKAVVSFANTNSSRCPNLS